MAYLYRHIRLDKKEVFYIGMCLKNDPKYHRAYNTTYRSNWWKSIVNKTEYEVEIVLENLSCEEAKIKEKEFIKIYGRSELSDKGTLCNMTDGGDGTLGWIMPKATRQKLSNKKKGIPPSEKVINAATKAKKGKPLSKSHRDKISKKVINISTGKIYISVKEAALENGYNIRTFREYLNGTIFNKTPFRLLENDKSVTTKKDKSQKGSKNGNAKKVIDIETGIIYNCVIDAAKNSDVSVTALYQQLRGKNKHKTTLRYLSNQINNEYNIY